MTIGLVKFYKRNKINENTTVLFTSASSANKDRLYDNDVTSKLVSVGSDDLTPEVWDFTFSNYEKMLDPLYLMALWRSVVLATINTLACVILGYPLALFLAFKAGKFKSVLFFLLILPFWTNFLIRTYAWVVLLSDNGWINKMIHVLGFPDTNFEMLFTPQAVAIGMIYNYLPYMVMSLFVSLEKLDTRLLDASSDLGAGPMTTFFKVILPLSTPGLVAGSIMVFIPSIGEYVIPDILGGGRTVYVGNMLGTQFLSLRNWPLGSALSAVLVFLIFVVLWFLEKWSDKDEVYS
jgi:spermidine/putrescine transport system permease protein